jgi:hypothetical protein
MAIDTGEPAPLAGFQDTVLPSTETETVPSCFLYEAATSAILWGVGWNDSLSLNDAGKKN